MRDLLRESGFQRVHTYADFQETHQDENPDFLIHVAEKAYGSRHHPGASVDAAEDMKARDVSEKYYDSSDADNFYFSVWGGEDIHIGLYETTPDIREASRLTVEKMAGMLDPLTHAKAVLDIGAGYGGSARYLARAFNVPVRCLNISETQNQKNREMNEAQGLDGLVSVVHGSFENLPEPDGTYDVVWAQDALLHSGNRELVFQEASRVLKPGGEFIFTDPMQHDDCPDGVLQPVYDRIHLSSLGSFAFYKETAERLGFEVLDMIDLTDNLRTHYSRVREELLSRSDALRNEVSEDYLDRMIIGLENWVKAADSGYMAWGILHFRKV